MKKTHRTNQYSPARITPNEPAMAMRLDQPWAVPCPTAILSIGLLLAAPGVVPTHLVTVPLL
jgi:hypothetical protein